MKNTIFLIFITFNLISNNANITSNLNYDENIYNQQVILSSIDEINKFKSLHPAQCYHFVICLHLYNINLMDEYIDKINQFIGKNHDNHYYLKITIPVDKNIDDFNHPSPLVNHNISKDLMKNIVIKSTPYHKHLITNNNIETLYKIENRLRQNINLNQQDIQVIFMENRGVDIGGFFIALDQIKQQNMHHDFIMKIHTKTDPILRKKISSFLDIYVNSLLENNKVIDSYSAKFYTKNDPNIYHQQNYPYVCHISKKLNIEFPEKFDFSCGTMFIASKEFSYFLCQYELLSLYNELNLGYPGKFKFQQLEHGYESCFGGIIKMLNLPKLTIN